jgi:hypothetical protein
MMLYSVKTKRWTALREGNSPPLFYWIWSKDSQSIYVRPEERATAIYRLSVPGGKWEKVSGLEGLRTRDGEGYLSLTADGRIATMSHTSVAQIYSLQWNH